MKKAPGSAMNGFWEKKSEKAGGQVQVTLHMELLAAVSNKGFSLDKLVVKTKELFNTKGMAGFVSVLLRLFDKFICLALVDKKRCAPISPCCEGCRYEIKDRRSWRFRTSIGEVAISWRRLQCVHCGRTLTPLRELLRIRAYQSKSRELERLVTEIVSDQTYRRRSRHLQAMGQVPVPMSTAHRWVMASDCDALPEELPRLETLLADGIGYKRRPEPAAGGSEPAKVLVSDGEPGLAEGLAQLAQAQQRCHWHRVHDLDYAMWHEGAGKAERCAEQHHLAGLLGTELPAGDLEPVSPADKADIEAASATAAEKLEHLVSQLQKKGYFRAASYIRRAKDHLFTYVRFWLRPGQSQGVLAAGAADAGVGPPPEKDRLRLE